MNIYLCILSGLFVGLLDALPMFKRKVPIFSIAAMWLQWVYVALAVTYIHIPEHAILRGAIFGVLGMMPFTLQLFYRNRPAVPGHFMASLVLGTLLGWILYNL